MTTTKMQAMVLALLGLSALGLSAQAGFRVNPYLQNPSSDGMSFTWFTTTDVASNLTIQGPGGPYAYTSTPTLQPVLDYTTAELNQNIPGLPRGSWLLEGPSYKHFVDVRGLAPNSVYTYTVQHGSDSFSAQFRTAPSANAWSRIRFIAVSDAETEPLGRVQRREWAPGAMAADSLPRPSTTSSLWKDKFGTRVLSGVSVLNYPLTEDEGYRRNVQTINSRNPAFLLMPGDLVQGGGYQPGWDEFFRQNAGPVGSGLSTYPILPALGNWENFGALNGGYGFDADGRYGPKFARDKYHVYFDAPDNGTPAHRDNYYRIDYGPITIITL